MNKLVEETTNPSPNVINKVSPSFSIRKLLHNKHVLYAISTCLFLLLWDFIAVIQVFGTFMPRPIEVLFTLGDMMVNPLAGKTLFMHLWASLRRVLIAFMIAVGIGVPIGVLMGFSRVAYAIIRPIFDLFKPMPPIAWISLAILWFGIGETSKVFIIIIGAIVPCILNSYNGIRLVDESLKEALRMLGGNRRQEIFEVVLPASFPAIFAGMQISLSMAWTTVLAAELVGAREGMGFIIVMGMNLSKPSMIFAGMIVIALTSLMISTTVSYLERWVCPWKTELE